MVEKALIAREVELDAGAELLLEGNLTRPENAAGLVLFAHGSGSSRHSPRNRFVAGVLQQGGLGTLLFDLLSAQEEQIDRFTRHLRFDIGLLARRLDAATSWVRAQPELAAFPVGYFGSSTGAAAALIAAADRPGDVAAVVSRGGRPDLAGPALPRVTQPTLLIVGSRDVPVIGMNEEALAQMRQEESRIEIVPGASHLFEEPGTLEQAAGLARDWFVQHLGSGE
jgi:putative phosphoribosyl transferase